jgi:hypothetical protein
MCHTQAVVQKCAGGGVLQERWRIGENNRRRRKRGQRRFVKTAQNQLLFTCVRPA